MNLRSYCVDNGFMLKSSLLGAVKLTKNAILINILILGMVFHSIYMERFHCEMVGLVRT